MTRQTTRVYPHLDTKATKSLPLDEVGVILRAADDIIAVGGRTLLTKILRGSRSQDVLSRGLDLNPAYGVYKALSAEEVLSRIDWTILHGYLRIVFEGRLPVLVYTPTGWGIERETYANEIIHAFDRLLTSAQRPYAVGYLKDKNRELILLVLEKIQALGGRKYVPVLEDWAQLDYKKVRQRIREVIEELLVADDAEADARFAKIVESGETIPWSDARHYLEERLEGKQMPRPNAKKKQE